MSSQQFHEAVNAVLASLGRVSSDIAALRDAVVLIDKEIGDVTGRLDRLEAEHG